MPISTRLRLFCDFLKSYLVQLNIFNTGTQDENIIQNERRSTRLYLVLLILSTVTLVLYHSIITYTETIVIQSPTFIQYSDLIQQRSLECSCSNITIKYEKFLDIEPHYQDLCQSDFVSNKWIDHLFILYQQSWNHPILIDFRRTGVFQFQTIRLLCQLAQDTIIDGLKSFRNTAFIQSQLVSKELFQVQINSFIKDFIEATPKTFLRTLRFVQDTTAQSLFMTGASLTSVRPITQYRYVLDGGVVPYPGMNYTFTDNSTCVCSASTATSCMGLAIFENNIVEGFQTGCYMLSALMNSTLEAFHNQTFVDMLSYPSKTIRKLNSSNSKWKVEILLRKMFVDFWSNSTSFEKYFYNCAPDSCRYKINQHNHFWFIILLLIGLVRGISSVLKVFIPIIIVYICPFVCKIIFQRRVRAIEIITVEPIPVSSMGVRMKMLFRLIKRKLIEFNLFKSIPPSQDENVLRQQRRQTRIYLVLLIAGLFILTLFTSIKSYTIIVTVESPSITNFAQLHEKYPVTLTCPCNQTTLEYNEFISDIKPQYHQICLSEFVTPRWINLQFIKSPVRVFFTNDIRYQSQIHFQLLSTLCRLANETIQENLESFYQTKFVTNQVLTRSAFQTQVDIILEEFEKTVPESYQRTLQLIQANSQINQFIVPLNSVFQTSDQYNQFTEFTPALNNYRYNLFCGGSLLCRCIDVYDNKCVLETMIAKSYNVIKIPGMFQTFFPLQSVLMSTLECFYNHTCLSQITRLINPVISSTNFSTLQLSLLSLNESKDDQIGKLANNLFIQSWNNQISYELYFKQCHPLTCRYSYESRFNIIYIITTVIGLLGGLGIVLQLFVTPVIKLVPQMWKNITRRQQNDIVPVVEVPSITSAFLDRLRDLITFIKKRLIELNLFPTIPPSQDETVLRRSRRITRIYLILLMMSIYILGIYTSLTQETVTIIEKTPSLSTYSQLFNQYPLILQCPCSHIAIKYHKFIIQFDPEYHPICSSIFVESNWSNAFSFPPHSLSGAKFFDNDFRFYAQKQFETVSEICSLSRKILNLSLPMWFQTDFITSRVISRTEFDIQIKGLIEEFKRKIGNQFIQTFKLIQVTNHANQLATTTRSSNWQFVGYLAQNLNEVSNIFNTSIAQNALHIFALPQTYGDDHCSCALYSNCSIPFSFPYRTSNQSLNQTLPGFRIGCLSLDALFQSSFSCLYNQTCLDLMRTAIYYSKPIPAKILTDSSLSDQNKTIETYLRQIFVRNWLRKTSFERYFNECAPESCQYSYTLKFNSVYFITTIIALFGGLTSGLHFLVSCVTVVVLKLNNHRKRNQVASHSQQQSNIVQLDLDRTSLEVAPLATITTVNLDPVGQQNNASTNYRKRAILICLSLLMLVSIAIVPVIWLRSQYTMPSPPLPTTTIITSITVTESTTTSPNICYMTLIYQPTAYQIGRGGRSLIVADFNKDSNQDLAVTNYDDHTISVLFGNENGTFQMHQVYSTGIGTNPWGITTADFNNDTFSDLAVALSATNRIAIFLGISSNGSFMTLPNISYIGTNDYSLFSVIEACDLNDDGFTDLLMGNRLRPGGDPGFLHALLNFGNTFQFSNGIIQLPNVQNIDSLVFIDLDNDGKQNDIGVCSLYNRVITSSPIKYDYPSTNYIKVEMNTMYESPQSIIRGRFNDDEFDDLALVSFKSATLQVLLAYGDRTFTQQIYLVDSSPISIARINFNNDSIDDVAILHCNQSVSIYVGTKLGIFHQNSILFHSGESITNQCAQSLKMGDFNKDGKDDLVFIDPGTNRVRVLLGATCNKHI